MSNTSTFRTVAAGGSLLLAVALFSAGVVHGQSRNVSQAAPTFSKDVAPILQRNCQRCHRPGSIGPMSLLTYDEARPWARAVQRQVVSRLMPPWDVDRLVGIQKFKNDPSLSDEEIQTIVKWADAGAPQGNPADMPPPVQWSVNDAFSFKPDLVVKLKKDFVLPAQGSDQWLNLEMEEPGNTEDRYIQALEVKPLKGASVIHHADASAVPAGAAANGMTLEGSELLVEYAIGKAGESYPEGNAKRLAKGSGVNLNLHLHSNGEEIAVNAALGMKFYPKGYQPKLVQFSRTMPSSSLRDQETIDIPPGASDVRTDSYSYVTRPMLITAYQPHMHFRGKRQCLEVIYPPASSEGGPTFAKSEILNCANFRFNWHLQYTYADDVQPLLPAGSVLHLMSWHDNSPAFKANPDPTAWIGYGRRSTDEMALAWMEYAYLTPEQYSAAVEARKKLKSSATQNQ